MKSTDMERIQRKLKQARKKEKQLEHKMNKNSGKSIGEYISSFYDSFYFDKTKIYNLNSQDITDKIKEMKKDLLEKEWGIVIRKSVRKTKISENEQAVKKLLELLK